MIDHKSLCDYSRPGWLPDWKDPRAYTDHGDNMAAWAWEFLRRNPEYQADYARYMSIPWCYPEGGKTPKLVGRTYNDEAEMIYFDADPPASSPTETVGEYRRRTGSEPVQLEPALLRKWGLVEMRDPDSKLIPAADHVIPPYMLDARSHELFQSRFRDPLSGQVMESRVDIVDGSKVFVSDWTQEDDDFMRVLAFDLRRPLGGQLEIAKEMLKQARDEMLEDDPDLPGVEAPLKVVNITAPGADTLLDALRVFDAVWTIGMERETIARQLWKHKGTSIETDRSGVSTFDYRLETAVDLVKDGYKDLLRWADFPKDLKKRTKNSHEKQETPGKRKKSP